jgi:peptidoglycan/LPS O-acetylase OafA/YrhL
MQFYIIWPLAMRIRDSGGRWAVALLLMAVSIFGRVVIYRSMGPPAMLASACNFDSISAGCLLGLLLNRERIRVRNRWEKIRHPALLLASIAAGVMMWLSHSQRLGVITVPLGNTMLAVALTLLVLDVLVVQQGGLVYRILNSRLLVTAGTLSYSAYLWQQVVLRPDGLSSLIGVGAWMDNPAISLALIASLAGASYFGFERSLTRFRRSLQ